MLASSIDVSNKRTAAKLTPTEATSTAIFNGKRTPEISASPDHFVFPAWIILQEIVKPVYSKSIPVIKAVIIAIPVEGFLANWASSSSAVSTLRHPRNAQNIAIGPIIKSHPAKLLEFITNLGTYSRQSPLNYPETISPVYRKISLRPVQQPLG